MSKQHNKLPPISFPGIGLVFGTGLGITFGPALFGDVSLGLVFGSTFGLIAGSVAYSLSKSNDGDEK
ncbi:hypothetical protein [Psychrobium sp. 1_MG-2023]|uniref:hypothetical protein n=1 Tax=Psychrobium sp. 1_MG-2023 TaxID=3062624 RepID=UPI000C329280|nr:hypothetical protein [Psychrobium sp. 1_MG-2023]MDP2562640.1 hypothetical protein [Psychrobium sp. 1_MG-2023]PKF53829.1 hypothetical protein CW748_17670 [Alteromonadales bacterium alter-6D02]